MNREKWDEYRRRAERELEVLQEAAYALDHRPPEDPVSPDQLARLDQFVFRYIKLQDLLGAKLFPALLSLLQEPLEEAPFVDKLARLEELQIVRMERWSELREIRNDLTHDYPEQIKLRNIVLKKAFESVEELEHILRRLIRLAG